MAYFYDELYAEKVERWPSEDIVAFVERNRREFGDGVILDLGCGAGRHSIFMAVRGLRVCGIDRSAVGIAYAREWAKRDLLDACFQIGDLQMLPYRSENFGGLVSWESVFYGDCGNVVQSITEAFRVLQTGGRFLISLKSSGDFRTREFPGKGPNTFATEQGLPMTFFGRSEIEQIFSPMSTELNIELLARSFQNGTRLRENYIVTGRKK
jgi:SAM-dependent methyltransferase